MPISIQKTSEMITQPQGNRLRLSINSESGAGSATIAHVEINDITQWDVPTVMQAFAMLKGAFYVKQAEIDS